MVSVLSSSTARYPVPTLNSNQANESTNYNGFSIRRFLPSTSQVLRNIHKIGLAAVALAAVSSLPGAEAGATLYGLCVAACTAAITAGTIGAGTPAALFCFEGCLPLLAAPPGPF